MSEGENTSTIDASLNLGNPPGGTSYHDTDVVWLMGEERTGGLEKMLALSDEPRQPRESWALSSSTQTRSPAQK
jgi:hypothetical protein